MRLVVQTDANTAVVADARSTVTMIVRHALGIVVFGAGLGVAAALLAKRLLSGQLFEVQPTDPATYGVVAVAAIAVGVLAAWAPARRAARIDPIASLRDG